MDENVKLQLDEMKIMRMGRIRWKKDLILKYHPTEEGSYPQISSTVPRHFEEGSWLGFHGPVPLISVPDPKEVGSYPQMSCCEGQTEGATRSATLQQGLIQRSEHVDHGVGIAGGVRCCVFSGRTHFFAHPPRSIKYYHPAQHPS